MPAFDGIDAINLTEPASAPGQDPACLPPSRPFNKKRAAKVAAALGFLGVAVYAVLSQSAFVATSQAVVTAPAIALRAPIEGFLKTGAFHIGDAIHEGDVYGTVDNPFLDRRPVYDINERLKVNRAAVAADQERERTLAGLQAELGGRLQAHYGASSAVLGAQQAEAQREADAKQALSAADGRESGRQGTLERQGWASHAAADHQRSAAVAAEAEAQAQLARLERLRAQGRALAAHTFVDAGGNDVPYSQQRLDEVHLRMADNTHGTALHTAEADALEDELVNVAKWSQQAGHTEVKSPLSGTVYNVVQYGGERVGAGDTIATLVDCRQAFVIVAVPQDRFAEIVQGSVVHFRLAGDDADRTGHVSAMTGDNASSASSLAVVPGQSKGESATIRVSMDDTGSGKECLVGRTARVLLPAGGSGLLGSIAHLFF